MKKLMIVLAALMFSITLIGCEDRKITDVQVIVVFYTGSNATTYETLRLEIGETLDEVEDPVRPGYDFEGWFTDYAFTQPFTFDTEMDKSMTLYAKWTALTNQITYHLDGGTNHADNPATYVSGERVVFRSPTRIDSSFKGWFSKPPSEVNLISDSPIQSTEGRGGDLELYAYFEGREYTVNFNATPTDYTHPPGITNPRFISMVSGAPMPALPVLSAEGYDFLGWWNADFTREYVEGDIYDLGRNAVFFAKWEESS